MRLNRKKAARIAAFSTLLIVAVVASYLLLLRHPGFFFAYSFSHGEITLYSDEPIPALPAGRILEEVESRLSRSPLAARPGIKNLHVYICNRGWRFVLFANTRYKVGGLAYFPLSENIFLRTARFDANRLVGYSGRETTGTPHAELLSTPPSTRRGSRRRSWGPSGRILTYSDARRFRNGRQYSRSFRSPSSSSSSS